MTAASTTWGLFLLVLLLGYGLVQVPKNIYNHSRTSYILSHMQFKLSQLYNEKVDVEDTLDSLIDDLTKFCMEIKSSNALRPCLEQIVKIVPEQYSDRIKLTVEDYENNRIVIKNRYDDTETEEKLIKLHYRLKTNIHIHHRVQTYWTQMISEAFYLEDIFNNQTNSDHRFVKENPLPPSWLRRKLFDQHSKLGKYFHILSIFK
jgi:outer membrane receptor for Fe3+-dicitrate